MADSVVTRDEDNEMSNGPTPKPGTVLRGEAGSALVVEPGTAPLDALLTMLEEEYGGERFAESNSVVAARAGEVRIETWHSYLKWQREDQGVDDFEDYWGPDGQGKRSITVAYFDGSVYDLGDEAQAAEVSS